jgi:hypothetical protein
LAERIRFVALLAEPDGLLLAGRGSSIYDPDAQLDFGAIKSGGTAEFMHRADRRWWFCQIEPLGRGSCGYLVLA